MRVVRHLDHDAVEARLGASLNEYGRVSREAGLTSEEAVMRLRRLLDGRSEARPGRRRWRLPTIPTRQIVLGTIGLVVAAVVGAVVLAGLSSGDDAAAPPPNEAAVLPAGVAGFAELFVSVYLGQAGEGAEHHLEPFIPEPIEMQGLPPGRLYVQNLATVNVRAGEGGWSVDVAAQVLRRMEEGYGDPAIQQYRVELRDDGQLRALGPPVLVPGI